MCMSFKLKEKTIYLSLISLISVILVVTFAVLVLTDTASYTDTFKSVLLLVIGYLFCDNKKSSGGDNNG